MATVDFKNSWFDTLTGRIGYAWAPGWLIYGQGGVAWAKNSADVTINGFDVGSLSRTRTGWTAGGGVEWMFAPRLVGVSGRQLHGLRLERSHYSHPVACAGGCAFSTKATAATVLVGVNYKFDWGKAPY